MKRFCMLIMVYNINVMRGKIISLLMILMLCGCQAKWQPNLITDINNLEGRKVGVNLAWEADYILTGRTDMEIYRYESVADLLLALNYNKIDAIAFDELSWKMIEDDSTGLIKIEPAIKTTGYVMYLNNQDLTNEFNSFLKEFKKTDIYEDFCQRESAFANDYIEPEIPLTGKGEVIRVAIPAGDYPRCFTLVGDKIPHGFDLEPLKYFSNEYDYQLEFTLSNYDDMVLGLQVGKYDIAVGYLSKEYKDDVEALGLKVSDPIDETPVYFIQKIEEHVTSNIDW